MSGYFDGHMAVEFYKGGWILRARLPTDLPAHINAAAAREMGEWRARNTAKFERLADTSGDSAA
jgi:hypothetical protein